MSLFSNLGGKRAVAMQAWTSLTAMCGAGRQFVRPIQSPIGRLVFVCKGNICRSPFAEQLARRAGVSSVSMGLEASNGSSANPTAIERASACGISLQQHRAQRFHADLLQPNDLLLAFEIFHAYTLQAMIPDGGPAVCLLGSFANLAHSHIHDPYGLSERYFDRCFAVIDRSVSHLIRSLPTMADVR